MNEVKPFEYFSRLESWSSRILCICSTRFSIDSPNPNTLVALVINPRDWASLITRSQLSGEPFLGETSFLTDSTNISAPPPGNPCIPASLRCLRTSSVEILVTSAIPSISMGEKQSKSMVGCLVRKDLSRFV